MTFIYKLFIVFFVILFLSTCKKGVDDPKFSFRTRKARLAGEWRMVSGKASYTEPFYNESYTFDGSNFNENYTSGSSPIVYVGKYSLNLNINKDGSFLFKEAFVNSRFEGGGTWNFNSGNGKAKSKESVAFLIDEVNQGYTNSHFFNRLKASFVYKIKELRNKKLVINSSGKIYSDSKGEYATFSSEYTFEQ
jgi:hypothetical protein